ncbi:MAG: hypothetical protein H6686_02175 [Fibrobacteria bacterium]|nr:hypothetical protein [Fibrobacteria bacterium]
MTPKLPHPDSLHPLHDSLLCAGVALHAGEGIQTEPEPGISSRRASLQLFGEVGTPNWRVAWTLAKPWQEAQWRQGKWRIQWEQDSTLASSVHLDLGPRIALDASHRRGGDELGARCVLPIAPRIDAGFQILRAHDRGRLRIRPDSMQSVDLTWEAVTNATGVDLQFRFENLGWLRTGVTRSEISPRSSAGPYQLRTEGQSNSWVLGWEPRHRGMLAEVSAHRADLVSRGVVDSTGTPRAYHQSRILAWKDAWRIGWREEGWQLTFGGGRDLLSAPATSFFTPFVSWNVLDPSEWSPLGSIASDQRLFLSGTIDVRTLEAHPSARFRLGRVQAELGAGIAWRAFDPVLITRETRLGLLGTGYSLETDTLRSPKLRIWSLDPDLDLSWETAGAGTLRITGAMVLPWKVVTLGRPGDQDTRGELPDRDPPRETRGFWQSSLIWTKTW